MASRPLTSLSASASLLHNNLASSPAGWICCAHNSLNVDSAKIMLHNFPTGASKDGPAGFQATSIRYVDFGPMVFLCVMSTNGTQIYNEDATAMLFYLPINDLTGSSPDPDMLKNHQGACAVFTHNHIAIGTSKGSLALVQVAGADKMWAMPEMTPCSPTTEVVDVCFAPLGNQVMSAHSNGDIRAWTADPNGTYANVNVVPNSGQAPVRIAAIGPRILVAFGPGTICLYDAITLESHAELTAHVRWLTAIDVRSDTGQFASVGEDTVLNVWAVDAASGEISVVHSGVAANKLLTGVSFVGASSVLVAAYDSEELFLTEL